MEVVAGVEALRPEHGPIFAVIGVFDGLHRGHAYLLRHLVREAKARGAKPAVITFDHHPDAILTGSAPPLLLDPAERLERLADAGVEVTVVQHFDEVVRRTTYDAFIETVQRGTRLGGLLMTPDAAFGFERRGTAEAVAAMGEQHGFDVVVVPPFTIDGGAVSSSQIRAAIERGDLATAERLLGRPVGLRGSASSGLLAFDWPMALPPDGQYPCRIDGRIGTATVHDGVVHLSTPTDGGSIHVELTT